MSAASPPGSARQEITLLASLAWPVVLSSLGMAGMSMVDFIVAGRLGEVAMGAVGIAHGLSFALMVPAMGTAHGVDPLVAQAYGAGRPGRAGAAAAKGAVWLALLTVAIMALHLQAEPLLRSLRQAPELLPDAVTYCRISALGVPAYSGFFLVRQVLQGNGLMRPAMWVVLAGNLVNLFVDLAFGLGWGPFPRWEVAGIAWATVAVRWVMFLGLLWIAWRPLLRSWPSAEEHAETSVLQVGRVALPVGLHHSVEAWAFVAAGMIAGSLGASAAAAHAAAINVASMAFMVAIGVGAAASTRVGNLYGAGLRWERSAWMAIGMGLCSMTLSAAAFALFPEAIASIYTPEAHVVAAVAAVLPLAAAFQWFDGAQAVAFGVLRGLGDTRVPSVIALVAFWGLAVPLQVGLAHGLGWGLPGVWVGLVVGLASVSVLLLARIRWFASQHQP